MKSAMSKIWTWVANSISNNDNHYAEQVYANKVPYKVK